MGRGAQHGLVLLLVVRKLVFVWISTCRAPACPGRLDQEAVDHLVIALVVVAQQIVVGRRRVVLRIVEAADLLGGVNHLLERVYVLHKLREDAEAALGRLVEQDIGRFAVAHRDDADLVRLDLEDGLDGALQRVLESDDSLGLRPSA